MLITFFDSEGMIHKEFVPEGSTVNGQYYLGMMQRLLARIRRVRPQSNAQGSWSLLHDNAPAHKCIAVRNFLASKSVQVDRLTIFRRSRALGIIQKQGNWETYELKLRYVGRILQSLPLLITTCFDR